MTGQKFEGAGFFLINPKLNLLLVLINEEGLYDFPKGAKDEGELPIDTAKRECFEECSILVDNNELMKCGPFFDGKLFLFCAETHKIPIITRNKKSGILEHTGYKWVKPQHFLSNCIPHLRPITKKLFSRLLKSAHPLMTDYI